MVPEGIYVHNNIKIFDEISKVLILKNLFGELDVLQKTCEGDQLDFEIFH